MNKSVKQKFRPAILSALVAGMMYTTPNVTYASDLDIYKKAVEGKTTLVLMLDTSGSMGFISQDYPGVCGTVRTENSGTTPNYVRRYCSSGGVKYYDRLSRLQDAMFQLLDDTSIKDDVVMGLAQFSSQSLNSSGNMVGDGHSGRIILPAQPLTAAHRQAMKNAVAQMEAVGGTPTPQAYAEAGAYLMGTNTTISEPVRKVVYAREGSRSRYFDCLSNGDPQQSGSDWYRYCNSFGSRVSSPPVNNAAGYYVDGSYRYYYTVADEAVSILGSGFEKSVSSTKIADRSRYESPLPKEGETEKLECNGQGIYFLTDGVPEPGNSNSRELMRSALNNSSFSAASGGLSGGQHSAAAWNNTGEFSRWLFDKNKNPAGVEIKTAVVGFGSVFAGVETKELTTDKGKKRTYYDCSTGPNADARNACNWGEKSHQDLPGVGGYGQGGFYYAASTQDIVDSVKNFIDELKKEIPAVPTGAIVIPQDTLAPDSLQSDAYLPLLEPMPGQNKVVWPGNLKKYRVKNGTIYGKTGSDTTALVFKADGTINPDIWDYWNTDSVADQAVVQTGGAFGKLPVPTTATPTLSRNVFLQTGASSLTSLSATTEKMTQLQADHGVTQLQQRHLLNFMGYPVAISTAAVTAAEIKAPATPHRVLGGVVHSTPQLITYGAGFTAASGELDDSTREDYLLFGSLEGAVHLVDASSGVEKMAFIPQQILTKQAAALTPNTSGSLNGVSPRDLEANPTAYGVDAPWVAHAEYSLTQSSPIKIKATKVYAYGGLRMGGDAFYGLDLTDPASPKILFTKTASSSGFSRLGQTWGKPVVTRVRYGDEVKLVVIIGGGYDLDYEKLDKDRNTATAVKGNALYVMDAENGNLLLAVGANTAATTGAPNRLINSNMKYSVAGRVKTLDRDADGLADHIYFNDLGGQVFRVDLQNALGAATSEFGHRVTRLANLTAAHGAGSPGPRFYEAPAVTIHDEENQRFAVVSVASGDRSSPLDVDVQNRVYAIVDRDVTKASLYTSNYTADSTNITLTGLTDAAASGHASTSILSADGDWKSAGWYRVLDEYTNKAGTTKTNQKGLKAFNELAAIRNDLYVSVYNPHETADSNPCSAQVLGASELHRYCLPFGVCAKLPSNRQRYLLGQGIQAVNFGPGNDDQSRRIIYPTPNPEKKEQGEGTLEYKAPPSLMPIRWYEKQPKLPAAKE